LTLQHTDTRPSVCECLDVIVVFRKDPVASICSARYDYGVHDGYVVPMGFASKFGSTLREILI
jgi:hypothetical protein